MADEKWSKTVGNIKKQISDVYAACENNINELIEKHNAGSSNPEANLSTGISLVAEIDKLVKEANESVMGIITNAINKAQALAITSNDKRVASFLNSLLDLQSKVISANNTKAESKKADSTEKQIERRYMWQFYQNVVAESEKFGIDMALMSNDMVEENQDEFIELLDGLKDIAEHALRIHESAGRIPEYRYQMVAVMDKYKEPNEERDSYDLARANSINEMLFDRDSEGKFTERFDFTMNPGAIGNSAELYWNTIIAEYNLRKEKGNENKIENARAELWEENDKKLLEACDMFVGLVDGKEGVNQAAVEEVKKLRNSLSMANAFNPQRDEIIKNINIIKTCEEVSRLEEEAINNLKLSPDETEEVKKTFNRRLERGQKNRLDADSSESELLAIYNEQSDKVTRAMANLLLSVDNSKKSEEAVKAIEKEREKTFRLVVDLFASNFAKKIASSKEDLIMQFGGKKEIINNIFLDIEGKKLIKRSKQITDKKFICEFNDEMLSPAARAYKHYLNLMEIKEKAIKLNKDLKKKPKLESEDIDAIIDFLAGGQGATNALLAAADMMSYEQGAIKRIREDARFFGNAFGFLADDENQVKAMKIIHDRIVDRLSKGVLKNNSPEHTTFKELLAEHNKENGIVDKKVKFINNKDFGKDRGSKNMLDPALHQKEMTMSKK